MEILTKSYYQIGKNEIKEILVFLKQNLPKKCTEFNYQLPFDILVNNPYQNFDVQDKLQEVADLMRKHLFINKPIKIMTLDNLDGGRFQTIDNLDCIFIGNSEIYDIEQKVAILAHEMSHYYLLRKHNIHFEETERNELLTELSTIYCGFGLLLLKGYKPYKTEIGNRIYTSQVGYISIDVIKKTIVETAYMRKQKPQWIIENVSIFHKLYFFLKLRKLSKEYNKSKR